jgi:nickel/cobalt exporter
MSAVFLSFLVGLGQGLLHAFGPDHCVAIVTLGARGKSAALRTALRFAGGHALTLGALASVCLLAGVGLSEAFERWAEIGGGLILIGLALAALMFPSALQHGHPHLGGHGDDHQHQSPVPLAAGALMALSGGRSLLLALPPLIVGGAMSLEAWSYLPGFALGVFAGMAAVGLLFATGVRRLDERGQLWLHRGSALSSAALGVFWIAVRI